MRAVGSQDEIADLARALLAHVEQARDLGADGVPRALLATEDPQAVAPTAVERAPARQLGLGPGPAAATLETLRAEIGDCQRCKLAPHRRTLVFGVGNP